MTDTQRLIIENQRAIMEVIEEICRNQGFQPEARKIRARIEATKRELGEVSEIDTNIITTTAWSG